MSISQNPLKLATANAPVVMGILNVTPDSFSDGGKFIHHDKALAHAFRMINEGAGIIDVGGESSRPGSLPVSIDEELARVIPIIRALKEQSKVFISIDTTKPEVMREALKAGASMVNDVDALAAPGAMEVVRDSGGDVCLMHRQGTSLTMQKNPHYDDVVDEVYAFLASRINACVAAGIAKHRICVDVGFGFGKTLTHNLTLIRHLKQFNALNVPLLIGVSRKHSIGELLNCTADKRLPGSLALALLAYVNGTSIFRVHDVLETVQALTVAKAVCALD